MLAQSEQINSWREDKVIITSKIRLTPILIFVITYFCQTLGKLWTLTDLLQCVSTVKNMSQYMLKSLYLSAYYTVLGYLLVIKCISCCNRSERLVFDNCQIAGTRFITWKLFAVFMVDVDCIHFSLLEAIVAACSSTYSALWVKYSTISSSSVGKTVCNI